MFLSVNIKVIATANTRKDNNNNMLVINKHHNKIRISIKPIEECLLFIIVVIKLILPNKELIPAISKENINTSTLVEEL
jgi:hypothetical protein